MSEGKKDSQIILSQTSINNEPDRRGVKEHRQVIRNIRVKEHIGMM